MKENTRILDLDEDEVRNRFDNAEEYAEALADEHIETVTEKPVIRRSDINRDQLVSTLLSMVDEDRIWD